MTSETIASLYETYRPRLYSYIRARIRHAEDAEDLTQDVFARTIANYDSFDPGKASFSTWIYTIANNALRDYLRRSASRGKHTIDAEDETLENLLSEPAEGEEKLCREVMCKALADALTLLPEREKQIVVLRFYEDMPHKEIAEQLGLSYANTRYLCHKAIQSIQDAFRQRDLL